MLYHSGTGLMSIVSLKCELFQSTIPSCSDLNDKLPVERRTDKMWQSHAVSSRPNVGDFFHAPLN